MIEINVILSWDEESAVWIAESQDLPGLILESGSFDALVERVKYAIPDLLELDGPITKLPITVDSKIVSRHTANGIMKRAGIDFHF